MIVQPRFNRREARSPGSLMAAGYTFTELKLPGSPSTTWFFMACVCAPIQTNRDCAPIQTNRDFAPYGGYGSAVKERRLAVKLKRGLLRKNGSQ